MSEERKTEELFGALERMHGIKKDQANGAAEVEQPVQVPQNPVLAEVATIFNGMQNQMAVSAVCLQKALGETNRLMVENATLTRDVRELRQLLALSGRKEEELRVRHSKLFEEVTFLKGRLDEVYGKDPDLGSVRGPLPDRKDRS